MREDLEDRFNVAMMNIYTQAKTEAKYNATTYHQMLTDIGGLQTAHDLINSKEISDGFTALWERKCLDLTMEAMILESPEFHELFTEDEMRIVKRRLIEYGHLKR